MNVVSHAFTHCQVDCEYVPVLTLSVIDGKGIVGKAGTLYRLEWLYLTEDYKEARVYKGYDHTTLSNAQIRDRIRSYCEQSCRRVSRSLLKNKHAIGYGYRQDE